MVRRLSDKRLARLIAGLLAALGVLMLGEAVLPLTVSDVLPNGIAAQFGAGFGIGLGVGIVSSVLGVAGANC